MTDLQITWRGLTSSDSLTDIIREKAEKLDRFHDKIGRVHVLVELPHKHKSQGKHFRVRIDLHVPGAELVVDRDGGEDPMYENAHAAVDDCFGAMERQLRDHARKHRASEERVTRPGGDVDDGDTTA